MRLLRRLVPLVLISGVALPVSAQQPPAPPAPAVDTAQTPPLATATSIPTAYDAMVEKLKAGDRTVDFTALRMAFTETPAYRGIMMTVYQSLWRTLSARDFEGVVKLADNVLRQNFVEPNAHMVAAIAHNELRHRSEATFHRFVADGLLASITSKGDGKTEATAYQVIDVSEEYAVFRAQGLTPKGQGASAPSAPGAPIIDRMTVVNRANEEVVMYFSVRRPSAPPAAGVSR